MTKRIDLIANSTITLAMTILYAYYYWHFCVD